MEPLDRGDVRRGRIVWQDGVADTPFELPTRDSIRRRIRELTASGLHPRAIAERLNQDGLKTRQGRRWSAELVAARLRRLERAGN